MFDTTRFDGSGLQNFETGLSEKSGGGSYHGGISKNIEDKRHKTHTILLNQRRVEDRNIRNTMSQEQFSLFRLYAQSSIIGMILSDLATTEIMKKNSSHHTIKPIETIEWSREKHIEIFENIRHGRLIYNRYLQEFINTKQIKDFNEFETLVMNNPVCYVNWKLSARDIAILDDECSMYAKAYGEFFQQKWDNGIYDIGSLFLDIASHEEGICKKSQDIITQLNSQYLQ